MNDDQITQSVNNLVNQPSDSGDGAQPSGLGLGINPAAQNPTPPPGDPQSSADNSEPAADQSETDNHISDVRGGGTPPHDTNAQSDDQAAASEPSENAQVSLDTTQSIDHGQNNSTDLDSIRRQALAQLTPLVNKLDQPAEEKYRTLIMMIQASDDQSLIQPAYDAANQITDETKKAEALLGVVNEINYFAKKNSQPADS